MSHRQDETQGKPRTLTRENHNGFAHWLALRARPLLPSATNHSNSEIRQRQDCQNLPSHGEKPSLRQILPRRPDDHQ